VNAESHKIFVAEVATIYCRTNVYVVELVGVVKAKEVVSFFGEESRIGESKVKVVVVERDIRTTKSSLTSTSGEIEEWENTIAPLSYSYNWE
jgi:hypothetical protein